MKIGIHYDTGFFPGTRNSRPVFRPEQVACDMRAIAQELHCAAVRISGGIPERLTIAAELAAAEGLEVWFSPQPCELDTREMLAVYEEYAERAEALRRRFDVKIVLVLGCEVSVFDRGFLPGADAFERMAQLSAPSPELFAEYQAIVTRLNTFLAQAAETSRARFSGPITYASGPWEQIDWTPFDIIGVDAYRDQANAATLGQHLDSLSAWGKPVAVTEFGCCTYLGAGKRGANGWAILEGEGEVQRLDGDYIRDEEEQVVYLRESLELYRQHHVDTAFWFTFASWNRQHRERPREDLDIASFGIVKLTGEQRSPKAVFHELAKLCPSTRVEGPCSG